MKNDRSEEVGSIIMYIKRRDDGFEIETMLQYEDRMVEFESKLKYHSPEAKMVNILVRILSSQRWLLQFLNLLSCFF